MSHPTLQSRGNADTAVVLLTGADRLSLDSVAFSLADSYASVCAISYDVRPNDEADAGLSIVRRVSRPVGQGVGVGDAEIFDLSDCCLSCSVKHDAGGTLASLRGQARVFLVSLPVGLEATPVARYLEDMMRLDSWGDGMGVAAVVNAVGLDEFEERFFDDDRLCVYGTGDEDGVFDERLPVVGRGCLSRHVDADGECACRDIIRAVARRDAVVVEDAHEADLCDIAGLYEVESSVGA